MRFPLLDRFALVSKNAPFATALPEERGKERRGWKTGQARNWNVGLSH
jgi:hypothetical protein